MVMHLDAKDLPAVYQLHIKKNCFLGLRLVRNLVDVERRAAVMV